MKQYVKCEFCSELVMVGDRIGDRIPHHTYKILMRGVPAEMISSATANIKCPASGLLMRVPTKVKDDTNKV